MKYSEETDIKNMLQLRHMLESMPDYCGDFFRGIDLNTTSNTRIGYAHDLRIFFRFLKQHFTDLSDVAMEDITLTYLERLDYIDIEKYIEYLKYYKKKPNGRPITNNQSGISRKLSTLKSFFNYLCVHRLISSNPMLAIKLPPKKDHEIVRLTDDEITQLLHSIEYYKISSKYHSNDFITVRNYTIIVLLLSTGIRISECVGLDITDLDFRNQSMLIHRKGGKNELLYLSDEAIETLLVYLEFRKKIIPLPDHENALFFSTMRQRICPATINRMIKIYANDIVPLKKITAHKLRSTYGTALYKSTGDIYLVANVLGHNDVNTTKRHYAAVEDDRRKEHRNAVQLHKSSS